MFLQNVLTNRLIFSWRIDSIVVKAFLDKSAKCWNKSSVKPNSYFIKTFICRGNITRKNSNEVKIDYAKNIRKDRLRLQANLVPQIKTQNYLLFCYYQKSVLKYNKISGKANYSYIESNEKVLQCNVSSNLGTLNFKNIKISCSHF